MTNEAARPARKWFALRFALYGFILAAFGVFAGLAHGDGSDPKAPLVVVAYLQLAALAVLVPVCLNSRASRDPGWLLRLFSRLAALMIVGLFALIVTALVVHVPGWTAPFILQAIIACFALAAVGVSVLVLALLRNGLAAQFVTSLLLLVVLAGPLLANPIIMWVSPSHRTLAIDCTSYASALVVTAYAADVDFYRGPRMYDWSVAGDYAFRIPGPFWACLLYCGVGLFLTLVFWPLRPRLT